MRLPELLIFNFYTKYSLEKIESFSFPNRRLKSMLTDFSLLLAMFFPLFLFTVVPFIVLDRSGPTTKLDLSYVLASIPFALMAFTMINKDFFNGRSVAKRIYGYQIIDDKTEKVASEMQCMIRNMTLIVWPVEALLALIYPNRRLGDFIAGTRLTNKEVIDPETILTDSVQLDKSRKFGKLIWASILFSIIFNLIMYFSSTLDNDKKEKAVANKLEYERRATPSDYSRLNYISTSSM